MSIYNFKQLRHQGAANPFMSMANKGKGGGSSGPTQSNVTQTNIPEYARPYVETMLGTAQSQIYQTDAEGNVTGFNPYVPYSANPADYVAPFSPLQQQSQAGAANLQVPGQYDYATALTGASGMGSLGSAGTALQYGDVGAGYGAQGAGYGALGSNYGNLGAMYGAAGASMAPQAQQLGMQGANAQRMYEHKATSPYHMQQFMSPYMQDVVDVGKREATRQSEIQRNQQQAQAVASGAYGGSRQAIIEAERQRNLGTQLNDIQTQGLQQAYQQAQQAQQFGANLGLQGAQTGLQGLSQAGNLYGMGIQGAQAGMQGVGMGIQGAQAGMQGAGLGLQGVSGAQAGYGQAGTQGQNLANIGTQQLAAQQGILNLQNQFGAQQTQQQQDIINNAINNYAMAQQYPQQQLSFMNSLIRGLPMQSSTTQSYQAAPSGISQLAGLGLGAYGMSQIGKKKGGRIKESDGLDKLGLYNALNG